MRGLRIALAGFIALACVSVLSARKASGAEFQRALTDGVFGEALRGSATGFAEAEAENLPAYQAPPITVECWARLDSKTAFNILLASGPKDSPLHWELYTYAGSGSLSAYVPGYTPSEIVSEVDITDGAWHYLVMVFEASRVRLFVDGVVVKDAEIGRARESVGAAGVLSFGMLNHGEGGLGCDGAIDEVRVSQGVREPQGKPDAPFDADDRTIGLWHFDRVVDGKAEDSSSNVNSASVLESDGKSLDEIDLEKYAPGPSPWEGPFETIALSIGQGTHDAGPPKQLLDGEWALAEGGEEADRLSDAPWKDAIPATVPGSVHSALVEAGVIPDPTVGKDDAAARMKSTKTWWYRREFGRLEGTGNLILSFDGVAIRCTVWLNGEQLGTHEGMFGGPRYDVGDKLRDRNTIVVKIDPAPGTGEFGPNEGWRNTVVFNNVYGWHYSNIPSLGIWRSVRIERQAPVKMIDPFVRTFDATAGEIGLHVQFEGPESGWSGRLMGSISPDNFPGETYAFEHRIESQKADKELQLRIRIPDARPWWPVDLGSPDLYRMSLTIRPDSPRAADHKSFTFGIRTIEMAPQPYGPHPRRYNWTFVVNGRPAFVKGTGWCTMDPLMDFSRERYDRFLTLAADQHVQMLRAWGSGMPETDVFYDLADEKGIMILQEWPTAWNSHRTQPIEMLEETVRLNTIRMRNHPSLVMYGAGNESSDPYGPAIDMMGRYSVELDGTRPFHRAEPWGGSQHNYNCYWGRQPLDHNVTMTAEFWGEFGLACMPVVESVMRYVPGEEKAVWPPAADGSLAYHTPIFNTADDLSRLTQYSAYFMPQDSLEHFVLGSQLSQATGVRHTLEHARTRWPDTTGALYYKMNDNYPAASWSCVDWYGAPKLGHYIFQDAFAPLHACVVFESLNTIGREATWPVYLLDDADALRGEDWRVVVRVFNANLIEIARETFHGSGSIERVVELGAVHLGTEQNATTPILTVAQVEVGGALRDRGWYWTNYEQNPGCLLELPRTSLMAAISDGKARIRNTGTLPAVGVSVARPGKADSFRVSDNYVWIDPGESIAVDVSDAAGLTADAWNADTVDVTSSAL